MIALAVLATACASDPSTVDVAPAPTTTTVAPAGATTTTAPRPRGTIVVGGTDAVPDSATTTVPGSPRPSATGPGSDAGHLLQPSGARSIVVQVLTQDGAEPRLATLDRITDLLGELSGKPVRAVGGTVPARDVWTAEELTDVADAAVAAVDQSEALVQLLFVHGRSDQGEETLGLAFRHDKAVVFSDRVDAAADGLVSAAAIERSVAVHELGHLLGLVDLWLPTNRADPAHPGHSANRRSVMYWAVESTLLTDLLAGGPPEDFDRDDLADLAAIRRG